MRRTFSPEDDLLRSLATLWAGVLVSQLFIPRVRQGPWPASVGWFLLASAAVVVAAAGWHMAVTLWYERSRISIGGWRLGVLILSPAFPVGGFCCALYSLRQGSRCHGRSGSVPQESRSAGAWA